VADHHAGERRVLQKRFQPLNSGKVQVIGGLVEQQNFGRLRQPPDSAAVGVSRSVKPARPRGSAMRDARSFSGTSARSRAAAITDRTVAPCANSEFCATLLRRVRLRIATSPVSGATRPYKISSKVDLPEPFGPIRPIRSPSETVNEIF
jgi:hypothetical protein